MPEFRSRPEDLPDPSPELVLWRVSIEAYLETAGRKKAEAFLYRVGELLASEESVALVFPIRPNSEAAAVAEARRKAVTMFRQYLPVLLARVNR